LLLIDPENGMSLLSGGDRSMVTGIKLWDKMKELPVNIFYTDHWKSYQEFVPSEILVQTKVETYTIKV
jgi:IS1 family transposase